MRKHLDDLNKLMLNLSAVGIKMEKKDQTIIILSSLPKAYSHFVDTMLYVKQTFTLSEVKVALNSKELQMKATTESEATGEGLFVREKYPKKNRFKSRYKSRNNNN